MTGGPPPAFARGRHLIDAYGRGGFRFGGLSHRGSILALPSGVLAWPVIAARALVLDDLAAALAEIPRLDVLIVGTGTEMIVLPDFIRSPFREAGISLDAMQTGPAARTYNVLVAEDRRVGAALMAVE